jgi:hypothetical protein
MTQMQDYQAIPDNREDGRLPRRWLQALEVTTNDSL